MKASPEDIYFFQKEHNKSVMKGILALPHCYYFLLFVRGSISGKCQIIFLISCQFHLNYVKISFTKKIINLPEVLNINTSYTLSLSYIFQNHAHLVFTIFSKYFSTSCIFINICLYTFWKT